MIDLINICVLCLMFMGKTSNFDQQKLGLFLPSAKDNTAKNRIFDNFLSKFLYGIFDIWKRKLCLKKVGQNFHYCEGLYIKIIIIYIKRKLRFPWSLS